MLQSFGWIILACMAVVILGIAIVIEVRRRKRASAERRAAWKMHQEWLRSSEAQKLSRGAGTSPGAGEKSSVG